MLSYVNIVKLFDTQLTKQTISHSSQEKMAKYARHEYTNNVDTFFAMVCIK